VGSFHPEKGHLSNQIIGLIEGIYLEKTGIYGGKIGFVRSGKAFYLLYLRRLH